MPKNRGGGDAWDNLVAACQTCNRTKGSRTPEEAEDGFKAASKKTE